MKRKLFRSIHRFCKVVVLLSFSVLIGFTDKIGTFRPFQEIKSEEIKEIQVVNGNRVIHNMTETEIEQLVDILVHVTHNGYAHDFENSIGGGLGERFVLEFHDGRIVSVGGFEVWRVGCYIAIDQEPYDDMDGTYSRQLYNLFSEYFRIWVENGMK